MGEKYWKRSKELRWFTPASRRNTANARPVTFVGVRRLQQKWTWIESREEFRESGREVRKGASQWRDVPEVTGK